MIKKQHSPGKDQMAEAAHNLTEWVIKLGGQVRYLQRESPYLEKTVLEERLKQYQRVLQLIYTRAKQQQIDLLPYYDALAEIEANLKTIQAGGQAVKPQEKIALFIDAANLSRFSRHGLEQDIDYAKLLTYFSKDATILRAYYYTGVESEAEVNTNPFLYFLKRSGYRLVTKQIRIFANGERKGNLDIEIALDMLELADKVDRVVLFSGDGDFVPVLERVGRKGVRTQVVSYVGDGKSPTSSDLIDVADIFTNLADIIDEIARHK